MELMLAVLRQAELIQISCSFKYMESGADIHMHIRQALHSDESGLQKELDQMRQASSRQQSERLRVEFFSSNYLIMISSLEVIELIK